MPKPLTKPGRYRLTLKPDALQAFSLLMSTQKPPRVGIGVTRPDGRYDVAVSQGLFDQLQTAALPKENLSDTLVRIVKGFG